MLCCGVVLHAICTGVHHLVDILQQRAFLLKVSLRTLNILQVPHCNTLISFKLWLKFTSPKNILSTFYRIHEQSVITDSLYCMILLNNAKYVLHIQTILQKKKPYCPTDKSTIEYLKTTVSSYLY